MVLLNQRQHGTEMKITINLAIFIFERVAGQSCELMGQSAWSVTGNWSVCYSLKLFLVCPINGA